MDTDAIIKVPVCDCARNEIRLRTDSLGRTHYVRQCLNCGREMDRIKKSALPTAPTIPFDERLREAWYTLRGEVYRLRHEQQEREWVEQRPERLAEYADYLETDHWESLRRQVLAKAMGRCQICGKPVQDVHHLTYEHRGREYLFELVALCHACHIEQYHPNGAAYYD